ncbi:c-type cytochrome [Salipiger sp.]|uniref:c-type cytochrome n=1 Tax=Salipiger sp. TaxID=2078585 RepID=UPI003A980A26
MKRPVLVLSAIAVAGGISGILVAEGAGPEPDRAEGTAIVEVAEPDTLTDEARAGRAAFDAVCAACHGTSGAGRFGFGPPLVHRLYEPSHHGDAAFVAAAARGVRAHHWPFGNMPPQPQVSVGEMTAIIAYIRAMQRANGID